MELAQVLDDVPLRHDALDVAAVGRDHQRPDPVAGQVGDRRPDGGTAGDGGHRVALPFEHIRYKHGLPLSESPWTTPPRRPLIRPPPSSRSAHGNGTGGAKLQRTDRSQPGENPLHQPTSSTMSSMPRTPEPAESPIPTVDAIRPGRTGRSPTPDPGDAGGTAPPGRRRVGEAGRGRPAGRPAPVHRERGRDRPQRPPGPGVEVEHQTDRHLPAGVFVIDAKGYKGLVHTKRQGPIRNLGPTELHVGRRNCTSSVETTWPAGGGRAGGAGLGAVGVGGSGPRPALPHQGGMGFRLGRRDQRRLGRLAPS